ncbi:MAG: response regulator [Synergistaceae bacterium]|jgi:PleD family two-component response regulator|nr:response regulator [Synergistaceae bacterium]
MPDLDLQDLPDDENVWQYLEENSEGKDEKNTAEKSAEESGGDAIKPGWKELTGRKVILALDDVNLHLIRITEILTPKFDVRIAKSPKAAMRILATTNIDLMLIDIEMPEMSGFEFLELIKTIPSKAGIPAIFVTAHATEEFVRKAAVVGASNYVVKPYEQSNLEKKVHDALEMTYEE